MGRLPPFPQRFLNSADFNLILESFVNIAVNKPVWTVNLVFEMNVLCFDSQWYNLTP